MRGCEVIITALGSENPPLRLLLGRQAIDLAIGKLDSVRQDIEAWREVSIATDFVEASKQ